MSGLSLSVLVVCLLAARTGALVSQSANLMLYWPEDPWPWHRSCSSHHCGSRDWAVTVLRHRTPKR